MSSIGLRVLDRPETNVSERVLKELSILGVAQISDCMGRLYGTTDLRPIHAGDLRMIGIALTVKTRPGDNLLVHKALSQGRPQDVIVVDGAGCLSNALVGELMLLQAQRSQVAGFVIDGAVRDVDAFRDENFPCFARGVTHRGPYKTGPGEMNIPVSVDGLVVSPGDIVIGDADGILAIPQNHASSILNLALAKQKSEEQAKSRIASGTHDKPWLETTLAKLREERG